MFALHAEKKLKLKDIISNFKVCMHKKSRTTSEVRPDLSGIWFHQINFTGYFLLYISF